MAFSLIQSKTGSTGAANASSCAITSSATGSGNLLVAFVTIAGTSGVTITPPSGWTQVGSSQGTSTGSATFAMFYLQNSSSGVTSHSFSFSSSVNAAVAFEEWSGVATASALDTSIAQQNAKSTASTTGTLSASGELAIWGLGISAASTLTYSSVLNSYTEDTSANATSTQATEAQATLFYNTSVGTAATSSGATMSGSGGIGNTTILAVFKAASGSTNFTTTITDTQLSSFDAIATTSATNSFTTTITEQLTSFDALATTSANFSYTTTITEQLTSFDAVATVQKNGNTTITEQLTSFYAEATVSASAAPAAPGETVTIGGTSVMVYDDGSFEVDNQLSSSSTLHMMSRDDAGTHHYTKGQQVRVSDSQRGLVFVGNIATAEEDRETPQTLIKTTIDCTDNTYFAAKRSYTGPEYENQYVGAIATDLLNNLTNEGVTANYASRRETTQGQFASGTLTNVSATTNVDDGDLELALAGSEVVITETSTSDFGVGTLIHTTSTNNSLQLTSTPALQFTATASLPGGGNLYVYRKIWAGSLAVGTNDTFSYDIWINGSSPEQKAGVILVFTDGTQFTSALSNSPDSQGIQPDATNDLTGLATNQWYSRSFTLPSLIYSGKTISYVMVGIEGDKLGNYAVYFRNVKYVHSGITTNFFNGTLSMNTLLSNSGYSTSALAVVTSYEQSGYRISGLHSISAAGLWQGGVLTWLQTLPTSTTITVETSCDFGATWQMCTNGQQIVAPLPGASLTSQDIQFRQTLTNIGTDPLYTPVLQEVVLEVSPSYNTTKSDVVATTDTQANWNAGTLTNTVALSSGDLVLNGYQQNWDAGGPIAFSNFYGLGVPTQYVLNRQLALQCNASGEVRSRQDYAGQWQNFTVEADINLANTTDAYGIIYRTTGWQNNSNTYAYAAFLSGTTITLARGSNSSSGTGSATAISSIAVTLSAGNSHHFKVVVSGTNHKVYVDDILYINATDSTYTAAGYVGLLYYNNSTTVNTGIFDNFGVCASLQGQRVAPSVSLASAGTLGNSLIQWYSTEPNSTSILIETSIDGGSTYQTCTNGGAIPNLTVGQSLSGVGVLVRATLNASNASIVPVLHGLTIWVQGAFSATGTRIGTPLNLVNVGRLGNSLVAWNANIPTNTTMSVSTSVDGGITYQSVASSGSPIPNLTTQPDPTIDTYASNTSANYTSTYRTGGSSATPTFDTAFSRLLLSGGTNALYVLNSPTGISDVDVIIDMDESDAGGCVWRYTDINNFYECVVCDASSNSGSTNTLSVYRIASGARIVVATGSISFVRGVPHRIRITMLASVIVAYFDGIQVCTYTDASPLTGGKTGLRESGGIARFYQLRVQPQGQDVTALSVQTKITLTTTDPTATPQVLDFTVAAHNPSIGNGALVPRTNISFKYLSDAFNDLTKLFPNGWWNIDNNKQFSIQAHTGTPAPWIATGADFLDTNLRVKSESPLYRNRQIVKNVLATTPLDETRIGDGTTRSWTLGYQMASAPTILVNGVAALVGVKGVDTGKDFYYAVGDPTITQEKTNPVYDATETIEFIGTGQYLTYSQYDDTVGQAAFATIEGGSGIVENIYDGTGLTKAQGDVLAQSLVQTYGILGYTLNGTTTRDGLQIGQLFTVFIPEHNVFDMQFLIRSIKIHLTPSDNTGLHLFWYTIEAVSGPDAGDWLRLYQH